MGTRREITYPGHLLPGLGRSCAEWRKSEADSENDREPDHPHGHLSALVGHGLLDHLINLESVNPFFHHTWSIASFPAPAKNSVMPLASSIYSNSLTFQPLYGIRHQNVATRIELSKRNTCHQ